MGTCTQIIDDGIGIDAETLPHIFLPFGQGSHVGTENHGGLGLGLSITLALVEAHGGSITGSSAGAGRGSTFSVYLPMLPLQHETPYAPHIPIRRATVQPLSALLVEDHAPTLRVLRQLLLADGHHVTAATSVTDALRAADQRTFDVLISDIGLPDGDGYHLMATLRERQQLVGIAITGFGGDTDRQRSSEAGFAAHLIKPIQLQTLRETLIRVVAAARPADQ
jgi:CheY-like chemotaxis protein